MQEVAERAEDVRPDALGNAMSIPLSLPHTVLGGENGVTVEGENLNNSQKRALAEESGFSHLQKEGESCRTNDVQGKVQRRFRLERELNDSFRGSMPGQRSAKALRCRVSRDTRPE
jgi:hypothetical protein